MCAPFRISSDTVNQETTVSNRVSPAPYLFTSGNKIVEGTIRFAVFEHVKDNLSNSL